MKSLKGICLECNAEGPITGFKHNKGCTAELNRRVESLEKRVEQLEPKPCKDWHAYMMGTGNCIKCGLPIEKYRIDSDFCQCKEPDIADISWENHEYIRGCKKCFKPLPPDGVDHLTTIAELLMGNGIESQRAYDLAKRILALTRAT